MLAPLLTLPTFPHISPEHRFRYKICMQQVLRRFLAEMTDFAAHFEKRPTFALFQRRNAPLWRDLVVFRQLRPGKLFLEKMEL